METRLDEVGDGIYRVSTYIPEADFQFNQYVLDAEEPLLFHCGMRALFPAVSEAVARVMPVERLRWITFGHVEADECGSMNQWLAAAPQSQVAHGLMGCIVSLNDLADREPRPLQDGEVIDLGRKQVRNIETPHVPHAWEAHILYEETTGTLLCGDLFTPTGNNPPLLDGGDIIGPAMAAEDMFGATCLTPQTAPTIRSLAELAPQRLAMMHGSVYTGDTVGALNALADAYGDRFTAATTNA